MDECWVYACHFSKKKGSRWYAIYGLNNVVAVVVVFFATH